MISLRGPIFRVIKHPLYSSYIRQRSVRLISTQATWKGQVFSEFLQRRRNETGNEGNRSVSVCENQENDNRAKKDQKLICLEPYAALSLKDVFPMQKENRELYSTLWHSSAHLLGRALEEYFEDRIDLVTGPSLSGLPYCYQYDAFLSDKPSQSDILSIQSILNKYIQNPVDFEYQEVSLSEATQLFKHSPSKLQIIQQLSASSNPCKYGVYKCGSFVDLCEGPHVQNSCVIRSMHLLDVCELNDSSNGKKKYRFSGISFMTDHHYKQYKEFMKEMQMRDHRVLGHQLGLLVFSEHSPGNVFFTSRGLSLYRSMQQFISENYLTEFSEVMTPLLFRPDLWKTSGHYDHYRDSMFSIHEGCSEDITSLPSDRESSSLIHTHSTASSDGTLVDDSDSTQRTTHSSPSVDHHHQSSLFLKPMNCPAHILLFSSSSRSYRDLPIRYCEFTALHRKENSGAVGGLTRLYSFHQDDGHIFCRDDQVDAEIGKVLHSVNDAYKRLGFDHSFVVSTKPESSEGSESTWSLAESMLKQCLETRNLAYSIQQGDGAFYAPKIDIHINDSLGRSHQCGTIQLDMQLPRLFGLKYKNSSGEFNTPVLIHRAIYGSLERFMGVWMEHCNACFPLFFSPYQVALLPVHPSHEQKCTELAREWRLKSRGLLCADVFAPDISLSKRVRQVRELRYNYACTIGENEIQNDLVSVRKRMSGDQPSVVSSAKQFFDLCMDELKLFSPLG